LSGVKLPKLGSLQDRIIRAHVTRESEKEVKKTQMLAMLVANSVDFGSQQAANTYEGKVKNLWNRYIALEYGLELAPEKEKEVQMLEFYQGFVKNLRPVLHNEGGKPVIKGLDNLLQLAEYKRKNEG
jgi:hypothetical protein